MSIVGNNTPREIKEKFELYKQKEAQNKRLLEEIMTKSVEFQRTCPHKNGTDEVTTWDGNYSQEIYPFSTRSRKGFNIFMGRECPDCGKFFPRRPGPPHEICYRCGGNMKEESRHEHNNEIIIVTKCEKCNHTYEIRERDLNDKVS